MRFTAEYTKMTAICSLPDRRSRAGFSRRAFTLVELLVVISVLAILLSILLPALTSAKTLAMRCICANNLRQINFALDLYRSDNNERYPCAKDPLASDNWLWMGRGWREFVEPYIGSCDVNNPSVLFCPQDATDPKKYDSTSYAYSMSFYYSYGYINTITSTAQQYGASIIRPMPQQLGDVAIPCGKIVVGEWYSNHLAITNDGGWWDSQEKGSRNYLFADGHTQFIKAEEICIANDGLPNPNVTIDGIRGFDWPR